MGETRRMEWQRGSGGGGGDSGGERNDGAGEGSGGGGGAGPAGERVGEGVLYVKVMTDEQMEVLRRQIAIYGTICEQLVEMHKAVTAHHDSLAGMRLGGLYSDPLMASGSHKIAARQRWTPTTMQLQILETMFKQGNGTPTKQKIKQITIELSQHGQISESNVYNWFQNRRARSKRKQMASLPNSGESEAEADEESPDEKKHRPDSYHHEHLPTGIHNHHYNLQSNAGVNTLPPELNQSQCIYRSNDSSRSSGSSDQMPYENILSTPRLEHLMDKFDMPTSFSPFHPGESYDVLG
ncbi:hypothetical protein Cni_G27711 [Canna indica]|uniref:Homeobox domain-containing protein n=1 Tax=Canna indica TaxID=4628 RepID=A0AAQ3QPK8_9LILI|nr:hypothetical protein Cni_G27711 [Canna indica]